MINTLILIFVLCLLTFQFYAFQKINNSFISFDEEMLRKLELHCERCTYEKNVELSHLRHAVNEYKITHTNDTLEIQHLKEELSHNYEEITKAYEDIKYYRRKTNELLVEIDLKDIRIKDLKNEIRGGTVK